jgi:pre-mRNA-splicing factor SPF27
MADTQQPLALTSAAHSEQKGWRRNQDLVDALPYVDNLAPEEKQAVDALIEEEVRCASAPRSSSCYAYAHLAHVHIPVQMARSTKRPSDFLSELPPVPVSRLAEVRCYCYYCSPTRGCPGPCGCQPMITLLLPPCAAQDHPLLAAELARVAAGEKLAAVSFERYNLNPPPAAQRGDPAAWRAALDNAHAQLEQQHNRLLNLELLLKFGPTTWRAHNEALAAYVARLQAALAATRAAIDDLNRERKLQQTAAGRELRALQDDYMSLLRKNAEIEAACRALEGEGEAMRRALGPDAVQQPGGGDAA